MANLSPGVNLAWQIAAYEAAEANYHFIEKEHLFIGILSLEKVVAGGPDQSGLDQNAWQELKTENSVLNKVLGSFGIEQTRLRRIIRKKLGNGGYKHTEKTIHRSETCKALFAKVAAVSDSERITALNLAAAIAENPEDLLTKVFSEMRVDPRVLRTALLTPNEKALARKNESQPDNDTPQLYLERYGRDLTQAAKEGKLGPFVGRRNELLQIIQTLARSMKNNPVLVGEAGVGKTAIVEALAVRASQGKDPQVLADKRIIELNIGVLIGGTKYRGEFEERLTKIIAEVRSNTNVILFIDEIHNLIGAGRAEGSMDAANIMKPALARGELRCIGATTISEYRSYIESDPALERRFEKITINEPSRDESLEILKGLRPKWEKHYNKKITDRALEAAVDLSLRFDTDHHLPDKAVDLVDKAGARMQIPCLSMAPKKKGKGMQVEVKPKPQYSDEVTEFTIAQVLSDKMGIPLEIILSHNEGFSNSRLLELDSFLNKRIIGQDEAIERVCQRLLMVHAGIGKRRGPLAVFLFLGPTGVGKTELAKSLSDFLFGSESNLLRYDMSEYMEQHSVSKLIGSPPGYVGHEEEGQLTGRLRTKPYSVVLLDEIEKAHPRIFDLFLQVFDEGRITDSKGRTVDAKNTIIILTSNIQPEAAKKLGFHPQEEKETNGALLKGVKQFFRPELINRIDEQIVFRPLSEDNIREILKTILNEISEDIMERYNVTLEFTEEVEKCIAHKGYSPEYGVRELSRTVEKLVQIPLSNLILSGKLKEHKAWLVVCSNEEISLVPQI